MFEFYFKLLMKRASEIDVPFIVRKKNNGIFELVLGGDTYHGTDMYDVVINFGQAECRKLLAKEVQ